MSGSFNPRARRGRDSVLAMIHSGITGFQSTRPQGARPLKSWILKLSWLFQSTRPQGARHGYCRPAQHSVMGFNPRARRGRDHQ